MPLQISVDRRKINSFCRDWKIAEFAFFGSVLRNDFGPGSDIDVLVTFGTDADWSLMDHVRMEEELSRILGRPVDVVTRPGIERSQNWLRREAILKSAETFYVAA